MPAPFPQGKGQPPMRTKLFLATALVAVATAPGFAQTQQQSQLSDTDRTFIENAASSNLFEIRSSQMMLENMGDDQDMPAVRQFAQKMIDDHQATNTQLQQIAGSHGMDMPQEPSSMHRTMLEELQGFSGAQLAPHYLQYQTVAHQDAVNLFQRHTQQGDDAELKQFAQRTLPTLQEHLDMVRSLQGGEGLAESDPARQPSGSR